MNLESIQLSVILPTFNERDNLSTLIDGIEAVLPSVRKEILVMDDRSPDGTYDTARKISEVNPSVRAILRDGTRGLGFSIREGIENSKGEWIAVMDSDLSHPPRYLREMVTLMSEFDAVAGSRYLKGGGMSPCWRYWLSYFSNRFVGWVTRVPISDSQYGYFIIRKSAVRALPFDRIFWGYGDYCIRLFHYFNLYGFRAAEIPVLNEAREHGRSKTVIIPVFIRYLIETMKLGLQRRRI